MPKVSMGYAKKIKKNKKEHSQAKKTDAPPHPAEPSANRITQEGR